MIYISSKGGENTVLFKDFICEQWWRQNKKSNMIIVHNNKTSIKSGIIPNVYKVDVTSINSVSCQLWLGIHPANTMMYMHIGVLIVTTKQMKEST